MSKCELEISSEEIVEYMLKTNSSIRQTASHFGLSKTLIWNRLKKYVGEDNDKLQALLIKNKVESKKNLKNNKG